MPKNTFFMQLREKDKKGTGLTAVSKKFLDHHRLVDVRHSHPCSDEISEALEISAAWAIRAARVRFTTPSGFGVPNRLPRALAAAKVALVRSEIASRSVR